MNTIIRYVLLLALLSSSAFAQKQITVESSSTAPNLQSDILIPGGKKITQGRVDLSTGTVLTIGTHYYATWAGNKTLTFAGATTLEGGSTSVKAVVAAVMTLGFPSSKRGGEANTAQTTLAVYPGLHTFTWVRIGGEVVLYDTVGLLNNFTATTDPTTSSDASLAYTKGSIWINTVSNAVFFCADPTTSAAVWKNITAGALAGTTTIPERFDLAGDITPTQISSNQNDYTPTGLSTATVLRLSTDAARSITGLAGGADGRIIILRNVGSFVITLTGQSSSSSAANRFSGNDVTIPANGMVVLQYDSTASRWSIQGTLIDNVTLTTASDGSLQRAAISGDVVIPAGSNTATVQSSVFTTERAATATLTNKTIDAGSNILKFKSYLVLSHPHNADGTGATLGTTATSIDLGHGTFSNSADQAGNYVEYRTMVPTDIDTTVELRAKLKFRLNAADTATHRYVLSTVSQADSSAAVGTPGTPINLDFAGDASGASGDVETVGWTTLTGWAATMTADRLLVVRLARDGDATQDASTQASTELGLVLEYSVSQ